MHRMRARRNRFDFWPLSLEPVLLASFLDGAMSSSAIVY